MDPFEQLLRKAIGLIVYKDWVFHIEKDAIGLWYLQVIIPREDEKSTWTGRKWRMSMHMTNSEIVQTALKAVLTAEEHEAREHFLYIGRAIFNPHMNVDKLWALMDNETSKEIRPKPVRSRL